MPWQVAVLVGWGLVAAIYDARSRRLPNRLTLGAVLVALLVLLLTGQGVVGTTATSCLLGGVGAALILIPAYAKGWLGAGDVKMGLAVGLLGGLKILLLTLAMGGVLLGGMAVGMVLRGQAAPGQRTLPFGTAYGIGFAAAALLAPAFYGGVY